MLLPKVGDIYPAPGVHQHHRAQIVAIDTHGVAAWDDDRQNPPTLHVKCSCGAEWLDVLVEAVSPVS